MTAIKSTSTSEPNPQIRETCREQYLFLLEFYVRCIQSPRLTKLNEMFYVPTTVAFRFLDFETVISKSKSIFHSLKIKWYIFIYQQDDELQLTPVNTQFQPQAGIADDIEPFYAGRSVLFALAQSAVSDVYRDFKIDVSVFKRMPKEIKPDVLVGKAEVDLSVHFAALRKEVIDSVKYPEAAVPVRNILEFSRCLLFCWFIIHLIVRFVNALIDRVKAKRSVHWGVCLLLRVSELMIWMKQFIVWDILRLTVLFGI